MFFIFAHYCLQNILFLCNSNDSAAFFLDQIEPAFLDRFFIRIADAHTKALSARRLIFLHILEANTADCEKTDMRKRRSDLSRRR